MDRRRLLLGALGLGASAVVAKAVDAPKVATATPASGGIVSGDALLGERGCELMMPLRMSQIRVGDVIEIRAVGTYRVTSVRVDDGEHFGDALDYMAGARELRRVVDREIRDIWRSR